jgi:hypothetical protein
MVAFTTFFNVISSAANTASRFLITCLVRSWIYSTHDQLFFASKRKINRGIRTVPSTIVPSGRAPGVPCVHRNGPARTPWANYVKCSQSGQAELILKQITETVKGSGHTSPGIGAEGAFFVTMCFTDIIKYISLLISFKIFRAY